MHVSERHVDACIAAAESIDLGELRSFHAETVSALGVTAFTFGNFTPKIAEDMVAHVRAALDDAKTAPLPRSEWPVSPVARLGDFSALGDGEFAEAGAWRLRLSPLSAEENNSGLVVYYQLGQVIMNQSLIHQ